MHDGVRSHTLQVPRAKIIILAFCNWEKAMGNQFTNEEHINAQIKKYITEPYPEWEYISGYHNCDKDVVIKHKQCGTLATKSMSTIRHKKKIRCDYCYQRQREEERKRKRREQLEEQEEQRIAKIRSQVCVQITFKSCPICNEILTHPQQTRCPRCRKAERNARKDKRIRHISSVTIDKDISLRALSIRDKGVCWLCNQIVDWNDAYTNDNNAFIAGDKYPSIDHVVPLAKGGKHSWNNVRLAHRTCNSKKSDTVIAPRSIF